MQVSITDITDVEKEISIQATASELAPHFDKAYRSYQPKVEVRGFRKGKAPLDLVKKIYGETIEYNSLDTVASDVYRQVIEERNIQPIGEPVLTDIDYKRGEALSFKVKYELKPAVALKEYKGIALERLVHQVTDREVDDEIERLRKSNATYEESPAAEGEDAVVTADIQQLDEAGTPLIGKKSEGARIHLGDETVFPEIRTALNNVTTGEARRATISQKHEDHEHTDHLELTATKIEKMVRPAFDDEFVKKITKGKVASAAEFRTQMRQDIEDYWKERSDRRLIDDLVGEIVRRHEITVPESLVKGVLESLMEELKNRYPNKKLPPDFNEKEFRESNRGYAIFQAKWFLIREQIIEEEKLTSDEADLVKQAEIDAPKVGIDKERLLQFYQSSGAVKDRIVTEKLMALLRGASQITDKVVEEPF